ncbi:MAG: hypothetical protein GY756_27290 [bacterium]|nr:hypothetical protein [bacterium]
MKSIKSKFKLLCTVLVVGLLLNSCNQDNNDIVAYRITEQDLIPEGISYSTLTNSFYVSSILKTKIVQVSKKNGDVKDFIPSDLVDMRFVGMFADDSNGYLWALGNMKKPDGRQSSVSRFDLKTGKLLKIYYQPDTVNHMYNDIIVDKKGDVYFTDSDGQSIYKIDKQTDSITLFYECEEIFHPNGITISPDNKYLYIASGTNGIRTLNIEKRKVVGEVNPSVDSKGLDGIEYYKNSIIGIQNYIKDIHKTKISRYYLDQDGKNLMHEEIIDQNNLYFDIPTTLDIVDDYIYCLASSQLDNVDWTEYKIKDSSELKDVLILKYKLDK